MDPSFQTSSAISSPLRKRNEAISRLFVALLFGLLLVGATQAQVDRSGLSGTVTDESGRAMPGVQVTTVQTATELRREVVTSDTGTYSIPNMPVGTYTVTFTHDGFAPLMYNDLLQTVGRT